jgi:hypothetical protein
VTQQASTASRCDATCLRTGQNCLENAPLLPSCRLDAFRQKETQEITTMQRFGFTLVLFGLALILGVVGMLLTDGMAPGRFPPGFAAVAAAPGAC